MDVWLLMLAGCAVGLVPGRPRPQQHISDPYPTLSDIITLGYHVCNDTAFCTEQDATFTENRSNVKFQPCECGYCSCEPDCLETMDCCQDADLTNASRSVSRGAELVEYAADHGACHTSYYENRRFKSGFNLPLISNFTMVTTCENGDSCHIPDVPNITLAMNDIVAVHSDKDGRIYQNRRCAECNKATDVVPWDLVAISCNHQTSWYTVRDIQEQCLLLSVPPLEYRDTFSQCKTSITRCNETGQWTYHSPWLQYACERPEFTSPMERGYFRYKNIFCYFCNDPDIFDDYWTCSTEFNKNVLSSIGDLFRLEIDLDQVDISSAELATLQCDEDELFDYATGECRRLHCPLLTRPTGTECSPNPITPTPYELEFYIQLLPIDVTIQTLNMLYVLTSQDDSVTNIMKALGLSGICEVNSGAVYLDRAFGNSTYFRFIGWFGVFISHNCTRELVMSAMEALVNEQIVVSLTFNWNKIIKLRILQYDPPKRWKSKNEFEEVVRLQSLDFLQNVLMVDNDAFVRVTLTLVRPYRCPYVILTEAELCRAIQTNASIEQCQLDLEHSTPLASTIIPVHVYGDSFNSTIVYHVCIDEYFTYTSLAFSERSNVDDVMQLKGIISLTLTSLSLIAIILTLCIFHKQTTVRSDPYIILVLALFTMFVAQGTFQFGSGWTQERLICVVMGIIVHYTWLATTFLFNSYCMLVARKLQCIKANRCASDTIVMLCYSYLGPFIFIAINITSSLVQGTSIGYGNTGRICQQESSLLRALLFVLPICVTVAINIIVYVRLTYTIVNIASNPVLNKSGHQYIVPCLRLLGTTGLAWLAGLISQFLTSDVLDYLFILLAGGQGLIMFVLFNLPTRSASRAPASASNTSTVPKVLT